MAISPVNSQPSFKEAAVAAVPGGESAILVDRSQKNSVECEVALEESVTAPVSQGQRLGTLTVRSGQQILAQIPLVAQTGIARLTTLDVMGILLRRIAMAG